MGGQYTWCLGFGGEWHVPVKGPGQHEVVVATELGHARVELPIVDQTTGFTDYEEGKYNPVRRLG
jgi:hypothetical protein